MFPIAESFEQKFSFSGQTNKYIVQWRFLHLFVLIIRILRERCIDCLMSSDMSNALFCAKTAGAELPTSCVVYRSICIAVCPCMDASYPPSRSFIQILMGQNNGDENNQVNSEFIMRIFCCIR